MAYPEAIEHYPESFQLFIKTIHRRIEGGKNALIPIVGQTGCLSGDTIINTNRNELGRPYSIKHLYNVYNGIRNPRCRGWDLSKPTFIRSFDGKIIKLNKLKDVIYSGKKQTYKLILENGLNIKATEEHKFLTREHGWIELNQLKDKEVMCDTLNAKSSNRKRIKLRDIGLSVGKNHPYNIQQNKSISVHNLIYEARMNNLEFTEYLDILLNEPIRCKELKFINPSTHTIHHKDGCHYNNSIENLELMKRQEHYFKHNLYTNFSQGIPKFSKVLSIEFIGEEDTYDLECEEPNHNFVANGMIVHNSGKSLAALQCMRGLFMYRHGREPTDEEIIEHTIFKAKDFMSKMNNPKLKKKEVWLWDEAGIDVGHKDHASIKNRIIGWLAQTFRNLQQIVFFTVPSISFLDASVRKLLHYYIEIVTIHKKTKMTIAKPLEMQYNIRQDKIYYHNLRTRATNGEVLEVDLIGIPKITNELEKQYEIVKNEFTVDLNLLIQEKLDQMDAKENHTLTEQENEWIDYIKKNPGKLKKDYATIFGVSPPHISIFRRKCLKNNIDIDNYVKKPQYWLNLRNKPSKQLNFHKPSISK